MSTNFHTPHSDGDLLNADILNTPLGELDAALGDKQDILAEGEFENGDKTKLDGIEEGANVTDAENVNSVEADPIVGAVSGLVKADGAGNISAAVADTDYQSVPSEGAFENGDKTKLDTVDEDANNYVHPNHTGDVTSIGDGAQTIAARAVTFAKMAAIATLRILGRKTAESGDIEELTASDVRTMINVADGANAYVLEIHGNDHHSTDYQAELAEGAFEDGDKTKLDNVPSDTNSALAAKLDLQPGRTVFCFAGDDFATKLAAAAAITGKDTDNRATLLVEPGEYALSANCTLTEDYVDIVCLTGAKGGIKLTGAYSFLMDDGAGGTASDNVVDGVDFTGTSDGYIPILDNEPFVEFRRCVGGNYSFGDWSGLANACDMTDCTIGGYFCADGTNSGTVTNCTIGIYFCDSGGENSGTVTNCTIGGYFCFYGENSGTVTGCTIGVGCCDSGTNSGTVTDCTIGTGFCYYGTNSGTVTDCTIGDSFCYFGTNSGTVTDCTIGDSFCYFGTNSGTVTDCTIGDSFCYSGTNSGTVTNCTIGTDFCADDGENSGTVRHSTFTGDTQATLDGVLVAGGKYQLCIASDAVITELEYSA